MNSENRHIELLTQIHERLGKIEARITAIYGITEKRLSALENDMKPLVKNTVRYSVYFMLIGSALLIVSSALAYRFFGGH